MGVFGLVLASILSAATVTALTTADPWYSEGITARVAEVVCFSGAIIGAGLLSTSTFLPTRPRSGRTSRPRPRRAVAGVPPAIAALAIASVSGLVVLRQEALFAMSHRATTGLVLFLGYSLAPVLAWGMIARASEGSPAVAHRRSVEAIQAWSARLRPVGAFAAAAVFVSWAVFLPLPEPLITIDGDFADWRNMTETGDAPDDSVLQSSRSVVEFTFPEAGAYGTTLVVTDSGGASSTAHASFSVPNARPVAAFVHSVDGLNVTLDASASYDPDGVVVEYHWSFGDGEEGAGRTTTHTYYASKRYDVVLTVTDDEGYDHNARVNGILVGGPNRPPKAAALFKVQASTLSADASESFDPEGAPLRYVWDFGDGTGSSERTAVHVYEGPGEYEVGLTVYDDQNASADFLELVAVPNDPPVVEFGMEVDGLSVWVDGSETADEDGVEEFSWAFGDGAGDAGPTARHTYARAGTYLIRLLVTDARGANAFLEQSVSVSIPVGALFHPVASFATKQTNLHVEFFGDDSYDPDGRVVDYLWAFGDGTTGQGVHTAHLYTRPDVYEARLSVADEQGLVGSVSHTIDLRPAVPSETPPTARMALRVTGSTVRFDGLGSSAESGTVVSHRWSVSRPAAGLELVGASVVRDGPHLFLRARVAGDLYPGGVVSSVTFYIESDSGRSAGPIAGQEPEYAVRLGGEAGKVLAGLSGLFWYYAGTSPTTGAGWQWIAPVSSALRGSELEVRVFLSQLLAVDRPIRVMCAIEWAGSPVDLLPLWIAA